MESGGWEPVTAGVYLLAPPLTWSGSAWAGVLVGGEQARVGGLAAAYLHRLIDDPPDPIMIWTAAGREVRRQQPPGGPGWRFRQEQRGVRSPSSGATPPRTGVEDTVLDLVSTSDQSGAVGWVTSAVQRRLTTPARIERALARRLAVRHRALIQALLLDVADGAESPLELGYLRDVERAHGLPAGRRQVRRGRRVVDVFYEEYGLVVELDGRLGHVGSGRFRDLERDNAAASDGLLTLRYGWTDVRGRPCLVAVQAGQTLNRRGWSGMVGQCRRCRGIRLGDLAG